MTVAKTGRQMEKRRLSLSWCHSLCKVAYYITVMLIKITLYTYYKQKELCHAYSIDFNTLQIKHVAGDFNTYLKNNIPGNSMAASQFTDIYCIWECFCYILVVNSMFRYCHSMQFLQLLLCNRLSSKRIWCKIYTNIHHYNLKFRMPPPFKLLQ